MSKMDKLAGCVVLYHPDGAILKRIQVYLCELDVLYVLDNSEHPSGDLQNEFRTMSNKIDYIWMNGNQGIAKALNAALKKAHAQRYQWLLTLDQDSDITAAYVIRMREFLFGECPSDVAVVGGNWYVQGRPRRRSTFKYTYVNKLLTSGSVVHVPTAVRLGGYLNKLFIDEVDHEFCYRAMVHGYKNILLNDAVFEHHIGNMQKHGIITAYHYPPVRYYYISRNCRYVKKTYQNSGVLDGRDINKELWNVIKGIWYEDKRLKKYTAFVLGMADFRMEIFGKCRWKL